MEKLLFIHSAGPQGRQEGSDALIQYIKDHVGDEFEVIHPAMPNPNAPKYQEWKRVFEQELRKINGEVQLIGHSMGGSFLIKYLSEETLSQSINGLYVIASPFWGLDKDWQACEDFFLQEGFESKLPPINEVILYHSRHEDIVPIAHHKHYTSKMSNALSRELNSREHLFLDGLPELVQDINK